MAAERSEGIHTMEQRDTELGEGGLQESLGSNTFLFLSSYVIFRARCEDRKVELSRWLEDTNIDGGAQLLSCLGEGNRMYCEGGDPNHLERLRTVDSALTRVVAGVLEKFDFDYFLYGVRQGIDPGLSLQVRKDWNLVGSWKYYLCDDERNKYGDDDPACGLVRPSARRTLESYSTLMSGDLGDYQRSVFTPALCELEVLFLRVMYYSCYVWDLLSRPSRMVGPQVRGIVWRTRLQRREMERCFSSTRLTYHSGSALN